MDFSIAFSGGRLLEFYEDEHIYLVDGIIVPSVSQVIQFKYGCKYDSVDPAVLKRAAGRGTKVHEAVERFCKHGEDDGSEEVKNFRFLQDKNGFRVLGNEIPVLIDYDGITVAGRLDAVITKDGKQGGADIKSTSAFDKERTALQLNLYRIGYRQCYGVEWEFLAGIHLKGDTRRYIDLPINEEYAKQCLKEFKEAL